MGRLDLNTSGLLIFTNEGEVANRLMHPSHVIEREYAVRVHGEVKEEAIKLLKQGIQLEDGPAKFKKVEFRGGEGSNKWYHVVLTEGKNREVRRLWASVGVEVSRLIRIRYGKLFLPRGLARGQYQELSPQAVKQFLKQLGFKL